MVAEIDLASSILGTFSTPASLADGDPADSFLLVCSVTPSLNSTRISLRSMPKPSRSAISSTRWGESYMLRQVDSAKAALMLDSESPIFPRAASAQDFLKCASAIDLYKS